MAWVEDIQNNLQITTGDGQVYEPLIKIDSFTARFEFNISEFDFPEISGTKVDKRLRKGVRYPMEFFFQGENCIDQGRAFAESSNDKRPWIVLHPVFGQFTGQPTAIEMDASKLNVFQITCEVIETILEDGAQTVFNPKENVKYILVSAKESNISTFENSISSFEPSDVESMKDNASDMYNIAVPAITDQAIFNQYLNLYNDATTRIDNALSEVRFGIQVVQDLINYPAQFVIGVKEKLNIIKNQALALSDKVYNLNSYNEKKIFENNKGALIGTLIESISAPLDGDYQNATDVVYVIDQSLSIYNQFINELQQIQSPNGYDPEAYIPSADFISSLSYSMNYAISNLFSIALTAQQERSIFLEEDSNAIVLTHRFYGLDNEDVNLTRFVTTNNIGLNESLSIGKGRRIVYYV